MNKFYIEKDELLEIILSVIAISVAFALVFYGITGLTTYPKEFLIFTSICSVTIGSGFIFHEMGHKLLAIYYGAHARFRMWINGLVLMLVTSFFGFLFAAPGAVYIYSQNISKKENALISLIGPMINILMVFIFLMLRIFAPVVQYFPGLNGEFFGIQGGILNVWAFGAGINLMLGLFNMLPAFPLDGSKVFAWNKFVWLLITIAFLGLASFLFNPLIIISWVVMLIITLILSKFAFG